MNIYELSQGIAEGKWTCVDLVNGCLKAIAENDQEGKKLNTISELDPNALFYARQADEEIKSQGLKSPLHGIPVLLKDNIDSKGLHTTAGSYALHDLIAEEDATVTKKLREAGAIILGKANLSEFAYFMSRHGMPSGYSSMSGQVVHAYVPGVDPSGSSSGSAVAVSARFVPLAIGTETDGSLMSPSLANQITSIKPTIGLVSRKGILPISHVQDTAGPMALHVEDLADALSLMAGADPLDPATLTCQKKDYRASLSTDLTGLSVGIYGINEKNKEVMERAKEILTKAGAVVKEVSLEKVYLSESEALIHEFKQGVNVFLKQHHSERQSLTDILAFNASHAERCLKFGQDLLESCEKTSGLLKESAYIKKRLELTEETHRLLFGTLNNEKLDVLLGAGAHPTSNLAPISGAPCLCLPAKEAVVEEDTTKDTYEPMGYYLMGKPYTEDILLKTAYTLEQALEIMPKPAWALELEPSWKHNPSL